MTNDEMAEKIAHAIMCSISGVCLFIFQSLLLYCLWRLFVSHVLSFLPYHIKWIGYLDFSASFLFVKILLISFISRKSQCRSST